MRASSASLVYERIGWLPDMLHIVRCAPEWIWSVEKDDLNWSVVYRFSAHTCLKLIISSISCWNARMVWIIVMCSSILGMIREARGTPLTLASVYRSCLYPYTGYRFWVIGWCCLYWSLYHGILTYVSGSRKRNSLDASCAEAWSGRRITPYFTPMSVYWSILLLAISSDSVPMSR